jgi:hypothetical protein
MILYKIYFIILLMHLVYSVVDSVRVQWNRDLMFRTKKRRGYIYIYMKTVALSKNFVFLKLRPFF